MLFYFINMYVYLAFYSLWYSVYWGPLVGVEEHCVTLHPAGVSRETHT